MVACIIVGCVRLPIWPAKATGELGPQSDACSDRGFLGGKATLEVIFPRSRLEWSDLCPPQHPPSTPIHIHISSLQLYRALHHIASHDIHIQGSLPSARTEPADSTLDRDCICSSCSSHHAGTKPGTETIDANRSCFTLLCRALAPSFFPSLPPFHRHSLLGPITSHHVGRCCQHAGQPQQTWLPGAIV